MNHRWLVLRVSQALLKYQTGDYPVASWCRECGILRVLNDAVNEYEYWRPGRKDPYIDLPECSPKQAPQRLQAAPTVAMLLEERVLRREAAALERVSTAKARVDRVSELRARREVAEQERADRLRRLQEASGLEPR